MKNLIKAFEKYHLGLVVFLSFYLIYTVLTYKLVPISSDEEYRYIRGKAQLSYLLNSKALENIPLPLNEPDSYYLVTIANILNPKFYYEWFHLQNMLFGSLIFIAAYLLLFEYSKNSWFSTLAPVIIFLSPSFSGHLGFNPSDLPFAVLFLLNVYLIQKFQNQGFSFKKIITLGVTFWLLIGVRTLGFQIFLLYVIFQFLTAPKTGKLKFFLEESKNLTLIFFASMFLLTISWPYLGMNFFNHLPEIITANTSFYRWTNLVIFDSNFITSNNRPWDYLFRYLILTLPLYVMFLFIFSLYKIKNKLKIFLLITILLNFILYLAVQPVIYNGMRHFLFLIPLFGVMAGFGLYDLYISKINKVYKVGIYLVVILSTIYTLFYFIKLFPLQYSYFNELAGGVENNIEKYETDYWGGSYRKASEYIRDNLATDNPYDLKVYSCNVSYAMDYYSHKKFIMTIDKNEANLIVCSITEDKKRGLSGEIIKTIDLGNSPFLNIRKVK